MFRNLRNFFGILFFQGDSIGLIVFKWACRIETILMGVYRYMCVCIYAGKLRHDNDPRAVAFDAAALAHTLHYTLRRKVCIYFAEIITSEKLASRARVSYFNISYIPDTYRGETGFFRAFSTAKNFYLNALVVSRARRKKTRAEK